MPKLTIMPTPGIHPDPLTAAAAAADAAGQIGYGSARGIAATYGLEVEYLAAYGLSADWQDSGVDVGELTAWILSGGVIW